MNENNRGTPLWLIIGIAVCVSLVSIAVYDYLNKRYERQEAREIIERHEQEKDTAAAAAVHKDRLRHAINAGSVLKTYIAEYHANTGETPADLDALGLPPDWLPSDLLQEVEVRPGGLVVMHLPRKAACRAKSACKCALIAPPTNGIAVATFPTSPKQVTAAAMSRKNRQPSRWR